MKETILTPAQQNTLDAIIEFQDRHHRPPSYRELARELGMTPMGARGHVLALETKGFLSRVPHEYRSIQVLKREDEDLPLRGQVNAGQTVVVWEEVEEISFSDFFRPGCRVLLVSDDSLEHAHIQRGDYVIGGPCGEQRSHKIVGVIRRL